MILYNSNTAPSPRRARMFLAEKNAKIEMRDIDIGKGEQLESDFLAINPRATIPVLITDKGTAITENVAIAAYLEEKFPEPPLMGRDADERALVLMWNGLVEFHGAIPIADAFRNAHPAMKGRAITGQREIAQIPELAERGISRSNDFLTMLDERLSQSPYLAGDTFTFADISAFVTLAFARIIKLSVPEEMTTLSAWFKRVSERPSAKA